MNTCNTNQSPAPTPTHALLQFTIILLTLFVLISMMVMSIEVRRIMTSDVL